MSIVEEHNTNPSFPPNSHSKKAQKTPTPANIACNEQPAGVFLHTPTPSSTRLLRNLAQGVDVLGEEEVGVDKDHLHNIELNSNPIFLPNGHSNEIKQPSKSSMKCTRGID